MLNVGNGFFTAACGAHVTVKCTGDFHCLVVDSKREPVGLVGPFSGSARAVEFILPEDYDTFEVRTDEGSQWQAEWRGSARYEKVSKKRVELPMRHQQFETEEQKLQALMRQAISTVVQDPAREKDLEDENDFEVFEEDPFLVSGYEVREMEDEEYVGNITQRPQEAAESEIRENPDLEEGPEEKPPTAAYNASEKSEVAAE